MDAVSPTGCPTVGLCTRPGDLGWLHTPSEFFISRKLIKLDDPENLSWKPAELCYPGCHN